MSYYIYHTRFQPFTKLHEEELTYLVNNLKENDKIIIGVVNYYPLLESKEDSDWLNFDQRFNPLSYWERYTQILSFINPSWKDKIAAIVALPRPSKVEEKVLNNFLPPKNERIMVLPCVRKYDDQIQKIKRRGLMKNNERIFDIESYKFGSEYTIASSSLMFLLMWITNRYDVCKHFASDSVIESMKKLNVLNRLRTDISDQNFVENEIRAIYSAALIDRDSAGKSEKEIIYKILKDYNIDVAVEPPPTSIINVDINTTANSYINSNVINNDVSKIISEYISEIQDIINIKCPAIDSNSGRFIDLILLQQVKILESFCVVIERNKHEVLDKYTNKINSSNYIKFLDAVKRIIGDYKQKVISYIDELDKKQEPRDYNRNVAEYNVSIKSDVQRFISEINKFNLLDMLEG